jgi:histidinol-phosphatase (PHP family)
LAADEGSGMDDRGSGASATALPGDYHVHTAWSDGTGTVEQVAAWAAGIGLPEIAVADHFTPWPGEGEDWWLPPAQLDAYVADVRATAARHSDIVVLAGLEAEWVDGQEAELEKRLSALPLDVVVLGVHVVDGFAFDDPAFRGDPRWDDADALLAAYYRTVRRAAEWGRFDILAHVDYIGLWGHVPGPAVVPEIEAALDALAASGAAVELNTDRFSDPAGVMYPSVEILRGARARGIPLTIDSDAHEVEHVGRALDEAIRRARAAGYRETLRMSDRALVPLPET